MTFKFDVLKAVWASSMPMAGKVIMARLVDKADTETGIIDQRWTPSQTEIASDCSMSKSTVIEYLDRLERGEWLKRDRPATADALARGERTAYRLAIGTDELPPAKARKGRGKRAAEDPAPDASSLGGLDRQDDLDRPAVGGRPPSGPGVDRPANEPRPPGGHKSPSTHHDPTDASRAPAAADTAAAPLPGFEDIDPPPPPKPPKRKRRAKPAATGAPTEGQRVNGLAKVYTDVVSLTSFHAVRAVVAAAVKCGDYTDEQIRTGMASLAAQRMSCSHNTLRIEIEGLARAAPGRHQAYQDPSDTAGFHEDL